MRKKIATIIILSLALIALIFVGIYLNQRVRDDGVFVVILDPGHGGNDPGAVTDEIYEKEINLSIALLVRDKLDGIENLNVLMTRDKDEFISLKDRAKYANTHNADLFVSIHANALDDTTYSGIMTFHHPEKASSRKPAQSIQEALITATGAVDRGVRNEKYVVLQETEMAAVLVETGFMTNSDELAKLSDSNYQSKIATGIINGILAYSGY